MTRHSQQRGEGKIGCIVSLLVLILVVAAGIKILPVLYSNNQLASAAEDMCARAGLLTAPTLEAQLRAKASELEVPEALDKGAMVVTVTGDHMAGTCTVKLHYTRKIDFYGAYTWAVDTDKTISRPFMDVR